MSTSRKDGKRSILSMMCCLCRTSNEPSHVQTQCFDTNEPTDYVVEKLAIKNLPLSSFATPEDLMRYNKINRSKNIPFMKPLMTPSSSLASSSREITTMPMKSNMPLLPSQVPGTSSHNNTVYKHEEAVNPFHMQYPPKTVAIKDKEAQLVTNILNKHASLYTLDDKNPIPKDPLRPPRNTVVIPTSVREAFAKDTMFPGKNNPIQVHNQVIASSFKYPPRPTSAKKDMTPEMKETINALRLAQKPHFPGVQPKNQKSILPSITPQLTETEISSRILMDTVSENDGLFKLSTQALSSSMPINNKLTFEQKVPRIIEDDEQEEIVANIFLQRKGSPIRNKSSDSNIVTELIHGHEENEKISSDEIGKSEPLKSTSLESLEEYQEKTDALNQLKSQNLKWKIIIKHHAEKTKPETNKKLDLDKELQYNARHCLLDNTLNFPG